MPSDGFEAEMYCYVHKLQRLVNVLHHKLTTLSVKLYDDDSQLIEP